MACCVGEVCPTAAISWSVASLCSRRSPGQRRPARSRGLRRVGLVFGDGWIKLIPWLNVRDEEVHLRSEPTWVVQGSRGDSDKTSGPLGIFAAGQPRSAFGAKAALVLAASQARGEMVAELPFGQSKGFLRHEYSSDIPAASHALAVTAMTFKGHNWFDRAFVTNRSAHAAAGKRNFHCIVIFSVTPNAERRAVATCHRLSKTS
jgi:hypothetical protein